MSIVDFKNPPVVEVGFAVYFAPVPFLTTINLAARAFDLRTKMGMATIEQMPYVETRVENEKNVNVGGFKITPGLGKSGVRLDTADRSYHVILQDNRFSFTWTQQKDFAYPRYEDLKKRFFKMFEIFCHGAPQLGTITADFTQVGIGYTNLIPNDDSKALETLNLVDTSGFKEPEAIQFFTRQRLTNTDEIGRLYISLTTVSNFEEQSNGTIEQSEKLKFDLTFRGKPSQLNLDGVSKFLDRGREAIVNTFSQSLSDIGKDRFGEEKAK